MSGWKGRADLRCCAGIGATAARRTETEVATVIVRDILDDEGRALDQRLELGGRRASYVHLDITTEQDWGAAVKIAGERHGGLGVLVNSAAIYPGKGLEDATMADRQRRSQVNLTGAILGIKTALPCLRGRALVRPPGSAIINILSVVGVGGTPTETLHSTSEGYVKILTKAVAVEFGQRGNRVCVRSILPGAIETDTGNQIFVARARTLGADDQEVTREQSIAAHAIRPRHDRRHCQGDRIPRLGRVELRDWIRPSRRRRFQRAMTSRSCATCPKEGQRWAP